MPQLFMIIPVDMGGGRPDNALPQPPGGGYYPDNTLPSGGARPDNSLPWGPGRPDNTLPVPPVDPSWGVRPPPVDPGYGRPGVSGNRPDNSLPLPPDSTVPPGSVYPPLTELHTKTAVLAWLPGYGHRWVVLGGPPVATPTA